MPERVKKTKWGGVLQKENLGGYAGEGKEDKMRGVGVGVAGKKRGGGRSQKKKSRGRSVENYVFFRGGQILNGITHYSVPMKSFVTKAKKHIP